MKKISLSKRVSRIEERLWIIDNPPRFSAGDQVSWFFLKDTGEASLITRTVLSQQVNLNEYDGKHERHYICTDPNTTVGACMVHEQSIIYTVTDEFMEAVNGLSERLSPESDR